MRRVRGRLVTVRFPANVTPMHEHKAEAKHQAKARRRRPQPRGEGVAREA